jgi:hypothetical protein
MYKPAVNRIEYNDLSDDSDEKNEEEEEEDFKAEYVEYDNEPMKTMVDRLMRYKQ